jgi:hypothetical protein
MKSAKQPSQNDKRILVVSIIIFLASCVIVVLVLVNRTAPPPPDNIGGPRGTLIPGVAGSGDVVSQLTALPSAEPLTGPLADEVHAVAQMVSNCDDYNQARRSQMNQHIAWLLQPNTLPKDMIIALGTNTNGRLIFGMSTFTLAQWGEKQKAADSCLLPIGKKLNDMLAANGEARFTEFDG